MGDATRDAMGDATRDAMGDATRDARGRAVVRCARDATRTKTTRNDATFDFRDGARGATIATRARATRATRRWD